MADGRIAKSQCSEVSPITRFETKQEKIRNRVPYQGAVDIAQNFISINSNVWNGVKITMFFFVFIFLVFN